MHQLNEITTRVMGRLLTHLTQGIQVFTIQENEAHLLEVTLVEENILHPRGVGSFYRLVEKERKRGLLKAVNTYTVLVMDERLGKANPFDGLHIFPAQNNIPSHRNLEGFTLKDGVIYGFNKAIQRDVTGYMNAWVIGVLKDFLRAIGE